MLMERDYCVRVFDKFISHLRHVDEPLGVDTYIDKGTKIGDVGDNTREHHPNLNIFQLLYLVGESKLLKFFAWVASWLVELLADVLKRRQAHLV